MEQKIKIVLVESDPDRARMMIDGLTELGDYQITVLGDLFGLARKIADINPDAVVVDVMNPTRDVIEELTIATDPEGRAVTIFADQSDTALMRMALEAGVSAYVVNGLAPERIYPIIETAAVRYNMYSRVKKELETTRAALADRKTIDRAKGVLMKARGIDESEAYRILQKAAMDQGKKIAEVSAALISASELLG